MGIPIMYLCIRHFLPLGFVILYTFCVARRIFILLSLPVNHIKMEVLSAFKLQKYEENKTRDSLSTTTWCVD